MVSILPSARTPFDVIGADVGQALQQVIPGAVKERNERERGLGAIDQLQKELANAKGDISKILPAAARAVSLNPSLQKSGIIEHALKMAQAQRSGNVSLPGENPSAQNAQQPNQQQNFQPPVLPGMKTQQSPFFPTNIGPQGGPGNLPQAATSGEKKPLLNREQQIQEARQLQKQLNDNQIPTTLPEALAQVQAAEAEKKLMNDEIEKERKERVLSQRDYGQKAAEQLTKAYKEATPEQLAVFKKFGEEEAAKGNSEADIERSIAKKVVQFKNAMVNVENDLSAPRSYNRIQRGLNGDYKDLQQAGSDLRKHLQPLLDLGLYDTARDLLQKKGYGLEEREAIINPLSERGITALNKVPKTRGEGWFQPIKGGVPSNLPPMNPENIKQGLRDLKQADPNFSLALARKVFEDKGYDWRSFKDALNELEQEGFKLEDDQQTQRGYLDTPPLNKLDEFLEGLNLIGR